MDRKGARRLPPRPITLLVLAILVLVAIGLAVIVRNVVRDQEDRLLDQRADEAATYVDSLADSVNTSLVAASGLALLSASPDLFGAVIGELSGVLHDIVLVGTDGGTVTVLGGSGEAFTTGSMLADARADTIRAATSDMTVTPVMTDGGLRRVGFAVAVPGSEDRVVYVEFTFDLATSALEGGEAFADLDAALYAGTTPSPDVLLLRSGSGPIPSGPDIGRTELSIGQSTWLLEVASPSPLVGNAATATPWIVLVSGLAVAVLTAVLVETLLRRQSYAMALVAERTAELERAQAELRATDALKDEFLANVSHELRTPLTAVTGFSGLLLRESEFDDATRRQMLEGIARNAGDMRGMVERLLDYARLSAGRIQFEPQSVNLLDQVRAAIAAHDHLLAGRAVHVDVAADLQVTADPNSLGHIVGNLLSNAAKFSPAGSPIDVVASVEGDDAVIRVVDCGPGVAPELAEALFDRFVQGGAIGDHSAKGLGLGLAIAKRYVELHGGRIWFDDRNGTGGASVAFAVPLAAS